MTSIGELIRRWRETQSPRVSQVKLAAKAGVSQPSVWDWENGKKTPSDRHLRKLVKLKVLPKSVLRTIEV